MANQVLDFMTEYNEKALGTLRALGDLNVASTQWMINKQVELSQTLMQTGLENSKVIASAKSPNEAIDASGKMMESLSATMSDFVKETADNAVKTRDELKAVIDEAVKYNAEYASQAVEKGVEATKEVAKKAKAA
jgi:phasin family protein